MFSLFVTDFFREAKDIIDKEKIDFLQDKIQYNLGMEKEAENIYQKLIIIPYLEVMYYEIQVAQERFGISSSSPCFYKDFEDVENLLNEAFMLKNFFRNDRIQYLKRIDPTRNWDNIYQSEKENNDIRRLINSQLMLMSTSFKSFTRFLFFYMLKIFVTYSAIGLTISMLINIDILIIVEIALVFVILGEIYLLKIFLSDTTVDYRTYIDIIGKQI